MDCRKGLCTAEAGRCLLRTLPRKPQVPYAAGPWAGKTAFETPILPHQILTREQLVGQRDLSPLDRSIDVRISRLRRKLEADPQNPKIIKTVYGAGYLFSAAVSWS